MIVSRDFLCAFSIDLFTILPPRLREAAVVQTVDPVHGTPNKNIDPD